MNYSLLANQQDFNLNPRLMQYIKAIEYHNVHNIRPPISLNKQFSITKHDMTIIKQYLRKKSHNNKLKKPIGCHKKNPKYDIQIDDPRDRLEKPITICSNDSCAIYSSTKDFDKSLLGAKLAINKHPLEYNRLNLHENKPNLSTHDNTSFTSRRDSHPWMYNNDVIERKSPYTSESKTVNRLIVDKQMRKNNLDKIHGVVSTCDFTSPRGDLDPHNRIITKSKKANGNIPLNVTTWNSTDNISRKYIRVDNNDKKRDKNKDQPIKWVSHNFVDRNDDAYKPGYFKKGSHVNGNIIDFDSLLRYGASHDKSKGKIVSKMDTNNKWVDYQNTSCRKIPNMEQIRYQTTPFKGHGKGIGNVDLESTMWHGEPTRIPGHRDLGGVSINRFEDLFVNVQEKSIYPFDFPRGGVNSRDPQLYIDQPANII